MATGIKKTVPMKKTVNTALATMRATAEIHSAQILAFKHGLVWGIAETIWNKFADDEFDNNEIGHWQGAGYRVVKEITASGLELVKMLPALASKYIGLALSSGQVIPPM